MIKSTILSLAAFAALASLQSLHAAPVTVPNFSFETPTTGNGGGPNDRGTTVDGWTYVSTQAAGIENPNGKFTGDNTGAGTLPSPADGVNAGFINANGSTGSITSGASLATVSLGEIYTLNVAVGNALGQTPGNFTIALGYLNAGVFTAATTFALTNANLITDGTFQNFSTSFAVASGDVGKSLAVQLFETSTGVDAGANSNNPQIFFDNVRVDVVPEPSTWAMMLGGLGLLVGMNKFRRRAI